MSKIEIRNLYLIFGKVYLANLYTLFFSNLIHLTFTPLTVCIN